MTIDLKSFGELDFFIGEDCNGCFTDWGWGETAPHELAEDVNETIQSSLPERMKTHFEFCIQHFEEEAVLEVIFSLLEEEEVKEYNSNFVDTVMASLEYRCSLIVDEAQLKELQDEWQEAKEDYESLFLS